MKRSVFRDDRALSSAEAIVETNQNRIDLLFGARLISGGIIIGCHRAEIIVVVFDLP